MKQWIIVLTLLFGGACIGTSPEEAAQKAWGEEKGEADEYHRPGEACLDCHSAKFHPGEKVFAIAGTVYRRASDVDGLDDVEIDFEDDVGHTFTARTNRVGNFMVRVRKDLSAPEQRTRGRLNIPWKPVFPLKNIVVRYPPDGLTLPMISHVWQDGSCAGCHVGASAQFDKVEKVFLIAETN